MPKHQSKLVQQRTVRKYIAQKGEGFVLSRNAHRMETEKRNNEENDAGEENRMGRKQQKKKKKHCLKDLCSRVIPHIFLDRS